MRLIDADKYKREIMDIMACWNISPCLSPDERRESVKNLKTVLNILDEMPAAFDLESAIEKFEKYKSQQSENEMLSNSGKWLAQRVIEECEKILKSGTNATNGKNGS